MKPVSSSTFALITLAVCGITCQSNENLSDDIAIKAVEKMTQNMNCVFLSEWGGLTAVSENEMIANAKLFAPLTGRTPAQAFSFRFRETMEEGWLLDEVKPYMDGFEAIQISQLEYDRSECTFCGNWKIEEIQLELYPDSTGKLFEKQEYIIRWEKELGNSWISITDNDQSISWGVAEKDGFLYTQHCEKLDKAD